MSNATHRLGAATRITGSVVGSGDLTVAGAIEGNIQLDGSLLLEATSQLVGDVAATAIRIGGKITGNVQVDDKALLDFCSGIVFERGTVSSAALISGGIG